MFLKKCKNTLMKMMKRTMSPTTRMMTVMMTVMTTIHRFPQPMGTATGTRRPTSPATMTTSAPSSTSATQATASGAETSAVTGFDSSPLWVLPPAVKRSVSVTDFLSSLAGLVTRGFGAFSRGAQRHGHTIASATVMSGIRRIRRTVCPQIEDLEEEGSS